MSTLSQILLLISYAVIALAAAILPPRLWGADPQLAFMLGVFFFITAWQLHTWFNQLRQDERIGRRIEQLEDNSLLLRSDVERLRRNMGRHLEKTEGGPVGELASELRLLHTLLDQVMRQEASLKEKNKAHQSEEQPVMLQTKASPKDSIEKGVESEEADKGSAGMQVPLEGEALTEEDGAPEADQLYDSESEGVLGIRSPAPLPLDARAQVRVIADRERLLSVIRSSLSENRVDLYLQPTVRLPGRKNVHFECFSRVRDTEGHVLLPRQYMEAAEELGLAGTLDNLLLFRLIQLLRRIGARQPDTRFFCNLSLHSLQDEEFFPQFVDFMLANPEFSSRLVFEIAQADLAGVSRETSDQLLSLARRGFGFCLDQLEDIDTLDPRWLEEHYYTFIKADWRYLTETFPEQDVSIFVKSLRAKGVKLVASRIESDAQAVRAAQAGIELAQGYAYGQPAPAQHFSNQF